MNLPLVTPVMAHPLGRAVTLTPRITLLPLPDDADAANIRLAERIEPDAPLEEVHYADSTRLHAPEVIAAARDLLAIAGPDAAVLYIHQGVHRQPLNPLLPFLLARLDHRVRAFTARRRPGTRWQPAPQDLAALMCPDRAVLIIDDHQTRIGVRGTLRAARVHLTLIGPDGPNGGTP